MRIRRLFLRNWQRFVGEHELLLEGKAYAVVARREDKPRRSNWLGKTSLLEAVRFALYGEHRHAREDGWITDGEPDGQVRLELVDGTTVLRTRARGKATRLHIHTEGLNLGTGDEAQEKIVEHVGLTKEDFEASCYLGQRQLARMVLMRPEERTSIVAGWAQLEQLQEAEVHNAYMLGKLLDQTEMLRNEVRALGDREAAILVGGTAETLQEALRGHQGALEKARQRVATLEGSLPRLQQKLELLRRGVEYEQLEGEIGRVEVPLTDVATAARVRGQLAVARDTQSMARRQLQLAQDLARGDFDGRCPVAGTACPAKDAINGNLARNNRQKEAATQDLHAVSKQVADLEKEDRHHEALSQAAARSQGQRDLLRAKLDQLLPYYERAKLVGGSLDDVRADIERVNGELARERAALQNLAAAAEGCTRAVADLHAIRYTRGEHQKKLEELERQATPLREAAAILGKGGAQRRAAQGVLAAIERTANEDVLAACGIELRVEARWEQEGRDPAKTCEVCGHPFPASAKVKSCTRCLAPRGRHVVNKLEFQFGRSGGAEDLAGLALQLGASRWMREHRGAAWAVACVDEPFGHLDEEHRAAVGRQLPAMLRAAGFEQSFVVAHHAAALDALPGRIMVVGKGDRSTVQVVA